jgi:hypothetical protein
MHVFGGVVGDMAEVKTGEAFTFNLQRMEFNVENLHLA